jgi:WD40 repeat protein
MTGQCVLALLFIAVLGCTPDNEPQDQGPPLSIFERTRLAPGYREVHARTHAWGAAEVLAFSHDGRRLAIPRGYGGTVVVLDTKTWVELHVLEVDGDLHDLIFSPDDRFLYVASSGLHSAEVARFDAGTGALSHVYGDLVGDVEAMAVSPDGRILAILQDLRGGLVFRDTVTGEILRKLDASARDISLAPDGTGVILREGHWSRRFVPWNGDAASPFVVPGEDDDCWPGTLHSTPDGARLACAYTHLNSGEGEWTGSVRVFERRDDELRELARVDVRAASMVEHTALSPDGKVVAAAGAGNVVRTWSVPYMTLLAERRIPPPGMTFLRSSITGLAFSPDSQILAVARMEPTPVILRVAGLERMRPWPGHAGEITNLFFLDDGKRIRTVGRDGTVCHLHAENLTRLSRCAVPEGYEIAAVRGPKGDLLLVRARALLDETWPTGRPARILHAETCRTMRELTLPVGFAKEQPLWIPGSEDLALVGDGRVRFARFDTRTGKIGTAHPVTLPPDLEVTADGRRLFCPIPRDGGGFQGGARWVDIATGEVVAVFPPQRLHRGIRSAGLVPGDRSWYLGGTGLRLLDGETGGFLVDRSLGGALVCGVTFSRDGSRHALALAGEHAKDDAPDDTWCVVRICETDTGRTLHAIALAKWGPAILSPDGMRLAYVGTDGVLRLYTF